MRVTITSPVGPQTFDFEEVVHPAFVNVGFDEYLPFKDATADLEPCAQVLHYEERLGGISHDRGSAMSRQRLQRTRRSAAHRSSAGGLASQTPATRCRHRG